MVKYVIRIFSILFIFNIVLYSKADENKNNIIWHYNLKKYMFNIPNKYKSNRKSKWFIAEAFVFPEDIKKIYIQSNNDSDFIFQKYAKLLQLSDFSGIILNTHRKGMSWD